MTGTISGYWHTADPYEIIVLGLGICAACMIYGATRGGR